MNVFEMNRLCDIYQPDGDCDICPIGCFVHDDDREYADWCLENNWLDLNHSRRDIGDYSAGIYVCGEDLFDEEWKEWVENDMRHNWCKKYCNGRPDCQKEGHCFYARE